MERGGGRVREEEVIGKWDGCYLGVFPRGLVAVGLLGLGFVGHFGGGERDGFFWGGR